MDPNRLPTRGERIAGIIVSALVCLGTSAIAIPSVVIAITQPERANTGTTAALARPPGLWAVTAVMLLGAGRAAWRAFRDHQATSS